jgi:hypothetical protein
MFRYPLGFRIQRTYAIALSNWICAKFNHSVAAKFSTRFLSDIQEASRASQCQLGVRDSTMQDHWRWSWQEMGCQVAGLGQWKLHTFLLQSLSLESELPGRRCVANGRVVSMGRHEFSTSLAARISSVAVKAEVESGWVMTMNDDTSSHTWWWSFFKRACAGFVLVGS